MEQSGTSAAIRTPLDLFAHQLSEARAAEEIVLKQLETATSLLPGGETRSAVQRHSAETRTQIERLDQVFALLGVQRLDVPNPAAQGILSAAELALASAADDLAQTTLLLYASRTEFLEVATYNGLVQMARGLGLGDVSDLLQMSLEEENAMRQQVDAALYERAQQLDELMGMPGMSENNATLHGYS